MSSSHHRRADLAVVGAGPAGLAAAVAAASRGLSVVVVDAGNQPGGQYWRHPDEQAEALLAEIWQEVFADDRVIGALDHFFESGGNSLLATKVAARVSDRLEVELPLRSVFEAPVLRDQAVLLETILLAELEGEPTS